MSPKNTAELFLSYSRANRPAVNRVYEDLQTAGFVVWRDIDDIPAGSPDWWGEIRTAIDVCETMVLCLSIDALRSTVVSDEWNYARSKGKRIVPVIVDAVFDHPDIKAGKVIIPAWMTRANWVDLRPSNPELAATKENLHNTLRTPYMPQSVYITVKASQLPPNFVPRPREFEPLVKALAVDELTDAVALTAALRGAGGYGKTTLAKALCRDWRVNGAFPDGIHWTTLGEKLLTMSYEVREAELAARILDLIATITGERPSVIKLDAAQDALSKAVAGKRLLIVIDDAWSEAHVKPFLVPGKHHATVITTRFDDCIPKGADVVRQPVDQMEEADALNLLAFGVAHWEDERNWFVQTVKLLGHSAQLLGIVNGAINARLTSNKLLRTVLDEVKQRLDYYGVTAFQPDDTDLREKAFGQTLEVGIERLKAAEQTHYRALGIFPEDVPIPLTTLARVWELDAIPTADLCEKLAKSSLVQDFDEQALTVHDVTLKYLRQTLPNLGELHTRLLDSWGDTYTLPDIYAWRFYAYHLNGAGQLDALRTLLLDFRWLQAKLDATDVAALMTDCDEFPADEGLQLVKSAFSLSYHVLANDKAALAEQLSGRLFTYKEKWGIGDLLATIAPYPGRLHLLTGELLAAGSPLQRVLAGHNVTVNGALELANGRLLSWAADNMPRLWASDGTPLAGLHGHTDTVRGVLELANGRLLSWAADGTLRLWAADGAPLAVLNIYSGAVNGARELTDGRLLSWAADGTLRLWASDGAPLAVLPGHTGSVVGVLELTDRRLLSWSEDGSLWTWATDGTPLGAQKGHSARIRGALELADRRLLSWAADGTLRLWAADGAPIATLRGHAEAVLGARELADGRLLSWAMDHTLRLWMNNGKSVTTLPNGAVWGALELTDGRLLSWAADGTLRLWTYDGILLTTMLGHRRAVWGALELADGRLLSWAGDSTLRLWTSEGAALTVLFGHIGGGVKGVLVLTDGRILSWGGDHTLRLWMNNGMPLPVMQEHPSEVKDILALANGQLVSWSEDGVLRLWSSDGAALATLQGHSKNESGALELADGRLVSWDKDVLRLWSSDGAPLVELRGHHYSVSGALELADGRLVSWDRDTLRLWSSDGAPLVELRGHHGSVSGALELADGRLVSWSHDSTLRLWSLGGTSLIVLKGHSGIVKGALELADGRILSWSQDGTLRLWANDGTALAALQAHAKGVYGALLLSTGWLLSWGLDNVLRLWDTNGSLLAVLEGHTNTVSNIQEFSDGRILSWSRDGTLRLWANDGTPLATLVGHSSRVDGGLEFSDQRLLSWSYDGTLRLWTFDGVPLSVFYSDAPITCCVLLADGRTIAAGDTQGRVLFLRLVE